LAPFCTKHSPQHIDIMELPGVKDVHFALHPLAKGRRAGEVRNLGACLPGKGPKWSRNAGSPVKKKRALVGA
jgi:hypothetical protein